MLTFILIVDLIFVVWMSFGSLTPPLSASAVFAATGGLTGANVIAAVLSGVL